MKLLSLIILMAIAMLSFSVFAQEANQVDPAQTLSWLPAVIAMLKGIPGVGKVLAIIFQVISIVTATLTIVVGFIEAILAVPYYASKFKGSGKVAKIILDFREKYLPYLKHLSMFNVQKKK